jgi:tRNA A-37 threonylcarbamoyl transferase component Bud32
LIGTEAETRALPVLERYVVFDRLATGGMASIYLAQRRGSDQVCIIKVLHDHLAKDPVVGNRFLREAQVASLLDHPHIARLTDAGWDRGQFYLAMEYIAGQDLETMMFKLMEQRRMLPPELSATVGLQVLDGLSYAHDYRDSEGQHLQIVHRDLSPRNVMVTYAGDVKIIDFGLARTNLGDFRTAPGMVLGTLRYMSPEQAVAEPVDLRSDLYSWSVVLYEALSGRPLVMGANAQEILHMVVTQTPPPISDRNPNLPKALDAVFTKALNKGREDRYPSARALREALATAAPLLFAPADAIGDFVSGMYAAEKAKAEELLAKAQSGEYTQEPTRVGESPEFEATRAGVPNAQAEVGPAFEPTRFGLPAPTPSRAASTLLLDPASNPDAATRIRPDPAASWGSVNVRPVRSRQGWAIGGAAVVLGLAVSALGYGYLNQPETPTVKIIEGAPPGVSPSTPEVTVRVVAQGANDPSPSSSPIEERPQSDAKEGATKVRPKRTTPSRTDATPTAPPPVERPRPNKAVEPPEEREASQTTVEECLLTLRSEESRSTVRSCITNQKNTVMGAPNWEGCMTTCRAAKRSDK